MPRFVIAALLAMSATAGPSLAQTQSPLAAMTGRYEDERTNCTIKPDKRNFGSYFTIEADDTAPDTYRTLYGAYQGEGGSCAISSVERRQWADTPDALTITGACREEESEPAQSTIDLVPIFGGQSLAMRRKTGDWVNQQVYFRCDRQAQYNVALHDPDFSAMVVGTDGTDAQTDNWARPFTCSYASGGMELSRDNCRRQNQGDPEVMVWNNGNVVSVVDRGNGNGLLNARTARVEKRDDGDIVCWIIDRTKESFCREEIR